MFRPGRYVPHRTLRSAALRKKVSILPNRPGERAKPNHLVVKFDDLGNRSCSAGADDEPGPFSNDGCVAGITKKRPRQAGVIFGIQLDSQVDVVTTHSPGPSSATWYGLHVKRFSHPPAVAAVPIVSSPAEIQIAPRRPRLKVVRPRFAPGAPP